MPEGFRIATAFVQVSPDTEGFKEELKSKLDEATAGVEGRVKVTLDTSELDAKADEARAKVDELGHRTAAPSAHLNDADLSARTDEAKAKLDELDAKTARPDVGLVTGDFDAKVDEARGKLDELDGKRAEPQLGLSDADFNAKIDRAEARLDALNAKSASPHLGGSGGGGGGEGFGGGGGGEGGGLLGMLTLGLGSLMPGVGGAAMGLGLLGGVGAMTLGPVSKALSAAHQASLNVGLTPQQLAATQFSNSVAVQQAQDNVTMAREQAAQDAVTSAQSIEQAQMNLASVERNTAEQQVQAIHSVAQAQQGLEEANYGLSEAQYQLDQAWVQAREDIARLNDQLADSKINVQSAQLAIEQAIYQQRLVNQNAYSTDIDREQAALAVVRAKQQLKDAQDQETASQYAANLANKQGIEHSQTVIQAKQALTQAQYAQTNAQFAAADAQRQLTLAQLNGAQQIKQAQMQLAAAEEQASYQRMRDAQQVAIAERAVTNTIKEQQLQMAAMISTENQAANEFQKLMGRLSPAGRDFVNQVLSMRGAFKGLETDAQNATLPGFTSFLRDVQALLPTVDSGITQMGTAMSDGFSALGELMAQPEFATTLDGLITNGLTFADEVLPAFGQFAQELGIIGGEKGAVDGVANLLTGAAHGLTGMAAALGEDIPQINDFLTAAGALIAQIGPGLGQIIGLVAQTLEPVTHYLSAHPDGTIVTLLGQIVASMLLFKPLVGIVGAPFRALTMAVNSITGLPGVVKGIVEKIVAAWGGLSGMKAPSLGISGAMGAGAGAAGAAGAAAGRAAGTIPGLTMLTGDAALVANRGVLGPMSGVGVTTTASMMGPIGLALGAAAIGIGIAYYADQVRKASERAEGVIETAGGALAAASTVGTQHVSDSFRTMANQVANSAQSTGVTVERSGTYAAARFGDYTQNWDKHNTALIDVMQLGKTQFGQAAAEYIHTMGGNVQQLGANLRQQGKTLNQAYTDAMTAAFYQLGGKTKESWAQIEQVMTSGLDRYYQSMRQHTTDDYNQLQRVTAQYEDDAYHHRSDKIKQDLTALQQATQRWMDDSNNHLIDTSKTNIQTLSADMQKFIQDMTTHNSGAWAGDIIKLQKDTEGHFSDMADQLQKAASHKFDQEIASAQSDISRLVQQGNQNPLFGHAAGGLISGPGTGTSDSIPAWLSNGEFVVNARATSQHLELLHAINAGHYADGGLITGGPGGDMGAMWALADQRAINFAKAMAAFQQIASGASTSLGHGVGPGGQAAQAYAASRLGLHGWGPDQMAPLIKLWNQESSWNSYAVNPSSGAYGIPQSLGHGHPYNLGDYKAQVDWGLNYIASVYGSPGAAWSHEMAYNWYDQGGWLMPGTMPVNGLSRPEAVLTPAESEAFVAIVRQLTSGGPGGSPAGRTPVMVQQHFHGTQLPTPEQKAAMARDLALALGGP